MQEVAATDPYPEPGYSSLRPYSMLLKVFPFYTCIYF